MQTHLPLTQLSLPPVSGAWELHSCTSPHTLRAYAHVSLRHLDPINHYPLPHFVAASQGFSHTILPLLIPPVQDDMLSCNNGLADAAATRADAQDAKAEAEREAVNCQQDRQAIADISAAKEAAYAELEGTAATCAALVLAATDSEKDTCTTTWTAAETAVAMCEADQWVCGADGKACEADGKACEADKTACDAAKKR